MIGATVRREAEALERHAAEGGITRILRGLAAAGPSAEAEEGEEGPTEEDEVDMYFPPGLGVPGNWSQFNFGLNVYETLKIPRGLLQLDGHGDTSFNNVGACRTYCEWYLKAAEAEVAADLADGGAALDSRPPDDLDKDALFKECGEPLSALLQTGDPDLDSRLENVRRDW